MLSGQVAGQDQVVLTDDYLLTVNRMPVTLAGRSPFKRLVYPIPEPGGLGVHLTLDLAGRARFGPDVQWIDERDYTVDPRRAEKFYAAIRTYWPALPAGSGETSAKDGGRSIPRQQEASSRKAAA